MIKTIAIVFITIKPYVIKIVIFLKQIENNGYKVHVAVAVACFSTRFKGKPEARPSLLKWSRLLQVCLYPVFLAFRMKYVQCKGYQVSLG